MSKKLTSILSNLNNFHSLEVVDCANEAQLQVGEDSSLLMAQSHRARSHCIRSAELE